VDEPVPESFSFNDLIRNPETIHDKDTNEIDKKYEKFGNIVDQVFVEIPKHASKIIKNSFNDGKLYDNSVDEISKKIQTRINDKMSEILRKISIKISEISFYTPYVDYLLSANISIEKIELAKKESSDKEIQLTTKIHFIKKINFPELKRIIFAEIHVEIIIMLLEELFNIFLENFFNLLQENISDNIEEDKEFIEIIKGKTLINRDKADEFSKNISTEFSTEISKKVIEKISIRIQEEVENHFYKILNIIYRAFKVVDEYGDGKIEISNGQETSYKGQGGSSEQNSESPIEEQNFAEKIQNQHFTLTYDINEIKTLCYKTLNDELNGIKTAERNNLAKSLEDIVNKDVNKSKEVDIEHIVFIIFAILDSESLVFLYKIVEDYAKKVKNYYNVRKTDEPESGLEKIGLKDDHDQKSDTGNNDNDIERYIERFIIIRVWEEIIFKSIPLIIIMVCQ
ncbi:17353_t:CDS:1, partial [Dentiscutata heterogama]